MKTKFIGTSTIIFMLSTFFGCEIQTNWTVENEEINLLVVNGLITNEKKAHEICLSKPTNEMNKGNNPVSNALVYISDGDSTYRLTENIEKPGTYTTDINFRAVINKIYTLLIINNGHQYYSISNMYPVKPFNQLRLKFDENKQMFKIDSVTQSFLGDESSMYEINIDWRNLPGYDSILPEDKVARLYYYSLSTIDVSEVFAPGKEEIFFPAGTNIIERKYSLSPAHANFIRSMLLETEWRGGLFDVAQGNLYSNLSEGAVGFFGICTVIQESFTAK